MLDVAVRSAADSRDQAPFRHSGGARSTPDANIRSRTLRQSNMLATDPLPACAFLFDGSAEDVGDPPLAFFVEAVLKALSEVDPNGCVQSRFMTGLPMLHTLTTRTTEVHVVENRSGHTEAYDMDTYKYIIWEWLDSLNLTWSTINLEAGAKIFLKHTGECVTLVSLDPAIRARVDAALRATPGYVGAFEIDPGNPLHRIGFVEKLSYAAAILNGTVVQDRSIEGDEDWPLSGADSFKPGGLRWEPMGWLYTEGPPGLAKLELSDRGAQAVHGYQRKHEDTVAGRVLRAIERAYWLNPNRQSFKFTFAGIGGDGLEAIMPDGKFTEYLFNRKHKDGGSKSNFFVDVLGIEPEDWRYLAAQFYQGLLSAEPEKLEFREWDAGYGMRFNVEMRVRGRLGRTAVVRTGWMMRPGALPSLASAMPGDRDADLRDAVDPPILRPGTRGDTQWAQLWAWANAAGIQAAAGCVPTPMYLVGGDVISEGEVGTALVRIRDVRQGLGLWLSKSRTGDADRNGVVMFSPIASQSRDRAIAWAREVTVILKLNGVIAELEAIYL
ncbi:hypothetical protein Mrad2831_6391 (plasmid) [Methylobacterium radiotolerans JCM 2831]|uniref:DUF6883 domain-containing protein n=2 Tax=Methylobacterium radiotolerans TaxID=31998 RepID=B1M9Y6_METRJ|nr:hypothetical protein Mrad2831_6391 [Methylobacterium radiotolerans JCM 2831]